MLVTYLGPYDEVEIAATGQTCKRGDSIEVSTETAGRVPERDDPGEGLLAQDTCWSPADKPAPKKPAKSDTEGDNQ